MGQIEDLNKNIETLTEKIESISEKISTPLVKIDVSDADEDGDFKFMTDRQVMKKIVMNGGDVTGLGSADVPDYDIPTDLIDEDDNQDPEERAHFIVYGKLLLKSPDVVYTRNISDKYVDNEIEYPECFDKKHAMSDTHPLKTWVKDIKKEVKKSVKQVGIKTGEIVDAGIQLGIEVAAATVTLGSSAVIMPPGSGLPVAFSAVLSIFTSLQSFQTKIVTIVPFLAPLTFLGVLLPIAIVEVVIGIVNGALLAIVTAIGTIEGLISVITGIKSMLLGAVPAGIPSVEGANMTTSPPEEMELIVTANPSTINVGEMTKLDIIASKGSWKYDYSWSSTHNANIAFKFLSTEKTLEVSPPLTTTYKVEVTDSSGSKKIQDIIVTVI